MSVKLEPPHKLGVAREKFSKFILSEIKLRLKYMNPTIQRRHVLFFGLLRPQGGCFCLLPLCLMSQFAG